MGLINENFRESTAVRGWYEHPYVSTYSAQLKPQTLGKLYNRYGRGLSMTALLALGNNWKPVSSASLTIFESGAPSRPVTVSIGTSADASAGVTVTFATGDNSDDYARAGFDLIIPKEYTNKDYDVPLLLSYSAPNWTGKPYNDADGAVQITTALVDVQCFLGASAFGYGTGQPDPMNSGEYSRTTSTRIMKDTTGIEGGLVYQEQWEEIELANGGKGLWTRSIGEMDIRVDDQTDSFIITGRANNNTSNLTAASVAGTTQAIPSANGLIAEMKAASQEIDWTTGFDIDKFRAVKAQLENVGVMSPGVDFFVGTDLRSSIDLNLLDWLKDYSAGHTLYDSMGDVSFGVKTVDIEGITFYIQKLDALSNPNKFGLASYGYRKMGFMFPRGEYKVSVGVDRNSATVMNLPHVTLGYPSNNGEERKRVLKLEPGMNGLTGLGNIVANGYDGVKFYALSQVMPIFVHLHQAILVEGSNGSIGA